MTSGSWPNLVAAAESTQAIGYKNHILFTKEMLRRATQQPTPFVGCSHQSPMVARSVAAFVKSKPARLEASVCSVTECSCKSGRARAAPERGCGQLCAWHDGDYSGLLNIISFVI